MNAADRLQNLYDVIDRYAADEKAPNEGPFAFLREDMYVRLLSGSATSRTSAERLKTYLAKNILKINGGKDKVTYKNVLENLMGKASKKYQVDPVNLEDCFDYERNREAIRAEQDDFWALNPSRSKKTDVEITDKNIADLLEPEDNVPWLLFQWLSEDAEWHLLNVWTGMDDADESVDNEESMKKMQKEYMNMLHAIALQEIFYREFLEKPYEQLKDTLQNTLDGLSEGAEQLRMLSEQLRRQAEQVQRGEQTDWEKNIHEGLQVMEHYSEVVRLSRKLCMYLVLTVEQNINIGVEFQILLILGAVNTGRGAGRELSERLRTLKGRKIYGIFYPNPNRSRIYYELNAEAEEVFLQYWDHYPLEEARREFPGALHTYFEQLAMKAKKDKKKMKRAKWVIVRAGIARQKNDRS